MLYEQEIRPFFADRLPGVPYAAATLSMCSEVLGLDDEISIVASKAEEGEPNR
jgi:hypothetical protein